MSEQKNNIDDNFDDGWGEEGLFDLELPQSKTQKIIKEKTSPLGDEELALDYASEEQNTESWLSEDVTAASHDDEGVSEAADYLFDDFHPRFPWITGDLQTICNTVSKPVTDFFEYPEKKIKLALEDGDTLIGIVQRPIITDDRSHLTYRPLVVLVHGLGGDAESYYMRRAAKKYLTRGFPVLRLNLRGAGPSIKTCRKRYNAGSYVDLAQALRQLPKAYREQGVFLAGFSLGGNIVLRLLAEMGSGRYELEDVKIIAAGTVSAPIDLKSCSVRLNAWRNHFYQNWLLNKLKRQLLHEASSLPSKVKSVIANCQTILELDDRFTARLAGYKSGDDYYDDCSTDYRLTEIQTPTMMIQAYNDPWIPAKTYTRIDWQQLDKFILLMPRHGGHCGFHDESGDTWHDRNLSTWFEVCLLEELG